jgi:ABC-type nitrate/sulfonate/bicarbonate transport system ATPase subunit
MVQIEKLTYYYQKESPIFLDFSWKINPGERWSIIGPSGCGKTSLLYLMAGLRRPAGGHITHDESPLNGRQPLTGLVLQDYGLLPWATASENVSLGLRIQGKEKWEVWEITHKWLAQLGLEKIAAQYPAELSGGQRQRVAIARTMAMSPSLLLMDEPFASLDTLTREDLLDLVLELWKSLPSTMVLVTHNIEEAVFWGSRIMVFKDAPNTYPQIVENQFSGSPGYRGAPQFAARCKELRGLMERNGHSGKPAKS